MGTADFLSHLILIIGAITGAVCAIVAIKFKDSRGLYCIIALGCLGLAFVFGLNSFNIVVNGSGLTGGRPWTIIIMSGVMGLGLYRLRSHGRC